MALTINKKIYELKDLQIGDIIIEHMDMDTSEISIINSKCKTEYDGFGCYVIQINHSCFPHNGLFFLYNSYASYIKIADNIYLLKEISYGL